jgi:hypothetical protein
VLEIKLYTKLRVAMIGSCKFTFKKLTSKMKWPTCRREVGAKLREEPNAL